MEKNTTTEVSNRQQPRIMSAGIPLSEHVTNLQGGGHIPGHPSRMEEEYSEEDEPRTSPVKGLYPRNELKKLAMIWEEKSVAY